MCLFLTELGGRGDTVCVKKSVGRNKLLPQGLAVYSSPENKQMFAEEIRVCVSFCLKSLAFCNNCAIFEPVYLNMPLTYSNIFHPQLLHEGKPEDRIQTRTGQLVSVLAPFLLHHFIVFFEGLVISILPKKLSLCIYRLWTS